jgi:DNA polymerase-3 subunit beta
VKFTIQRNQIATPAVNALNGIPNNPMAPIYAGMRIEALNDKIVFTGSDGDITFTAYDYPSAVKETGSVVVPGKLFADVIRSLPDEEVCISSDTDHAQLIIKCGRAAFTLRTQPAGHYPQVPSGVGALGKVDGELFTAAVKQTVTSTAKNTGDPAITGILLEPSADALQFVATDKYRAAITEVPFPGNNAKDPIVLPASVGEKFIRAVDGEVTLGWDESLVMLQSGRTSVTTRTIAGAFPKWRQLLPRTPPDVTVPVEELTGAVKRAQLAVFSDTTPVAFIFTSGKLYVESGEEGSSSRDVVECDYSGDDFEVLLGIAKLLDGLAGCDKTVRFGWTEPLKPVYMQSGSFNYTILPRRRT